MKRKPAVTATAERREIVKSFRRKAKEFREQGKPEAITSVEVAELYEALANKIERGEF